jgi:protein-S-isoprenylcysteine O-methyltransferase Ste14
MILAALALTAQIGEIASLAGVALLSFGLALKARLEERFLAAELGAHAYDAYRRATPMLVPFLPRIG